MTLATRRKAPN